MAKYLATKERKTVAELTTMVQTEADRQSIHCLVQVNSCPVYGWSAKAKVQRSRATEYQPWIDQIVSNLRERYNLKG
jgi:hypothetical protein